MSNYGTEDLKIDEAIKLVGELSDALTWLEWWFCGKDDKMADHINQKTRDDISSIIQRASELSKK